MSSPREGSRNPSTAPPDGADGAHPTKERILQAAEEVFAQRGFHGASTRDIAARAQVNISSLHYHWASKETLYSAVFDRLFAHLVERVSEDFAPRTTPEDTRQVIERAMGGVFDFFADNPRVPRLLLQRFMDSDGRDSVPQEVTEGATQPASQTFSAWTREFTAGRMSDADINFLMLTVQSVLLVSMLDSPFVAAMLGGSPADPSVRAALRARVIHLVERLVGLE